MYSCKKCSFETNSISKLGNHYKYDHKVDRELYKCEKCNKEFKTESGFNQHTDKACLKQIYKDREKKCEKCGHNIQTRLNEHIKRCDGNGPRRLKERRDGGQKWALGKTYIELHGIEKTKEIKLKLKENYKKPVIEDDIELIRREKIRNNINERYKNGWESTAGRCKKLDYFSKTAGNIKVDGSWELKVAIYLDSLDVKWIRNKKRFEYFNSKKNRTSTYCPDFYIEDWNCYIEVKGYKTELDDIKWSQFQHKLEIWDKNKLSSLGIDIRYRKKEK